MISQAVGRDEAEEMVQQMREDVLEGADPEELLYEIGLEPDYVMDLLW